MEAGERLALTSLAVNLIVTGGKYFLGSISGSLALLADAVHSSADVVSSASIWAGIKLSRRKSKRFPFGLYKVENLVALITAILILLAGYEIVKCVLWAGERVNAANIPYAILGVILLSVLLGSFSFFELKIARKLSSPSLEADAQHLTTDLFSSGIILVGLIGTYWQVRFPLDRLAALGIVVLIVRMGLKIALDAIRVLLDASLDPNTINNIREIIQETPQVSKVISVTGRNSGRFKFIEAELALRVKDLEKAYALANQIESRIKSRIKNVDRILLHYEPSLRDSVIIALPITEDQTSLSEHFGEAPYFLLLTMRSRDGSFLEEKILPNPHCQNGGSGKGIRVSEWLIGLKVDEVVVAKKLDHKGPYYVFADAGVHLRQTDLRDIADVKAWLVGLENQTDAAEEVSRSIPANKVRPQRPEKEELP